MTWLRHAAWLALYAGLAFVLLLPLSARSESHLPDDGDAVLGLWITWWSSTHLLDGYPELFDANAFHPHPQGLLYSEPMLSEGVIGRALFANLDNPVLAANLLTLLTLAMSGLAAHLFFRELTGSTLGGFVGAMFFTFNAYTFSQLPRIQLITLQWLPLALLCLHRYYDRGRKGYLVGFFVFSVLQGLACFYYLLFYLVALAILLPVYLWAFPGHRTVRSIAWVGGTGLAVGAVLASVAVPILLLYRRYEFTSEPSSYDLLGYFVPKSQPLLYGWMDVAPSRIDHFLGYLGLALALFGLWRFAGTTRSTRSRKLVLAYLAVAVCGFLLSAGPDLAIGGVALGPGPYSLLDGIGPFANLRTPDRFSLLVTLGAALFVAFGASALLDHRSRGVRIAGSALLSVVLLGEHWSPRRVQGTEVPAGDTVPDVYRWLAAVESPGVVAELPVRPFRQIRLVTHEAYFSAIHGGTLLFNKPSFYPPAMELLQWELESFPSVNSVTLLRALGVNHAVVHPRRWSQGTPRRSRLRALARQEPELRLVKSFPVRDSDLWERYQLGGERLYTLPPLEREGAPRACDCREVPQETMTPSGIGGADAGLALDGDRGTKWSSGVTQVQGDYFEIAFDRPRRPERIELEMTFPYGEFPRHLEVNAYLGDVGRRLERIEDVWGTLALVRQLVKDPRSARLRYDFEPSGPADRLRLFLNRTERGNPPWSIAEIHVFERAAGPER